MTHKRYYKARCSVYEYAIWGYNKAKIIKQIKQIAKKHHVEGEPTDWFVCTREEGLVAHGGIGADGKEWRESL